MASRISFTLFLLLASAQAQAFGQGYDPQGGSPLSLMSAPKDPLAYYDMRAQARALLEQGKAAEAEPLAERITLQYPRDGENWALLGQIRRKLKKYPEAAAAYEMSGKLQRWGGAESSAASAATTHLLAGNKRAALDLLRRYTLEEGNMDRSWIYDDEDFVSLRSDPEFREIAGRPDTTGWSRDYGWRRDVDFLRDEVRRVNADYRNHALPPEFERRYEELKRNVPRLSDEEILVGMSRMLAILRQGHTNIGNPGTSRLPPKALPFQLWVFPEGLFIVDAVEGQKSLVGSRLISIEGVPAEEALRRVNETQSVDGDNQYLAHGPQRLRMMAFLAGLGIAKSSDSVRLELQRPGGARRRVAIEASLSGFSSELAPPPGVKPPFVRDSSQLHWHRALPEQDALYVQLNGVSDEKDESLTQYALRLRSLFAEAAPKSLILDMRHNGGGSTHIYAEFVRTMVAFSLLPGRRLYVLIGRSTYSAAGNLITELEQLADAVMVGEPSSECCTFYASPSPFTLPFSKLTGRLATKRWSLSRKPHDFRREMHPHLPVMITAKDHFAGRDPVMETVFRMIGRNEAKPAPSQ